MSDQIINIISIIFGAIGCILAIVQTANLTRVKKIVRNHGDDLKSRISHEHKSLNNLEELMQGKNNINWGDSKPELVGMIHERVENCKLIEESFDVFIDSTVGK